MKHRKIILILLILVLFTGCSQDNPVEISEQDQNIVTPAVQETPTIDQEGITPVPTEEVEIGENEENVVIGENDENLENEDKEENKGNQESEDDVATTDNEITSTIVPSFGMQISQFENLGRAEEANNYWMRYNGLLWSEYQPDNSSQFINNSALEANLIAADEAGMEVILIVRSTPSWAQLYDGWFCGPTKEENIQDFADFMYRIVEVYSEAPFNIQYYEIWNEPDGTQVTPTYPCGCWGDPEDPYFGGGYYGKMLESVYPAVKSANPDAQVVLGGVLMDCDPRNPGADGYCPAGYFLGNQSKFFEGILIENEGRAYFDYVNFHGFTYYEPGVSPIEMEKVGFGWPVWSANGGQVEGRLSYIKEVMASYNIDKPILMTENTLLDYWGKVDWSDVDQIEAFEAAKADYVVWLYSRNLARDIAGTTWYVLDGPGWLNGGLLDGAQNPLPAYTAFQVMTKALHNARYQQDLSLGSGIFGFEFSNDTNRVWVLFSEDGLGKSIPAPLGLIRAYDLFEQPMTVENGMIGFLRPIYIELSP